MIWIDCADPLLTKNFPHLHEDMFKCPKLADNKMAEVSHTEMGLNCPSYHQALELVQEKMVTGLGDDNREGY